MAVDILLGLQWGDEGKGKIVDYLAGKYNVVARFQGGPNAGHTLEFDGIKIVLHQVPSGIFHSSIKNVIGNGVVLDPITLYKKEAKNLLEHGIDITQNLYISKRTQIIVPSHRMLDKAYEASKGENKIGTTAKGIGPAYQDKIGRTGIRVGDILMPDFKKKYEELKAKHKTILDFYEFDYSGLEEEETEFFEAIDYLKNFKLISTEYFINEAIKKGDSILAEGAQGSLLDIDYGTYPYVTSSNTTVAGACTGLGIAPKNIGNVIGIFKAYCTRVGSGPFPTELKDKTGEELQVAGNEFGSTTGRPRRCGWIDLPALKYTIMLSGVTELWMMKADVLNDFEEIKACTSYKVDGEETGELPFELNEGVKPIYDTLKGWNTSLEGINNLDTAPAELKEYIKYLEEKLEVPISAISVGPDRTETILRETVLA